MKLIRGDDNDYKQWKEVIKEILHLEQLLKFGRQSEGYKDDIIETQTLLLNTKDELIGQLRSEIGELKT